MADKGPGVGSWKSYLFYGVILLLLFNLLYTFSATPQIPEMAYSVFLEQVLKNNAKEVVMGTRTPALAVELKNPIKIDSPNGKVAESRYFKVVLPPNDTGLLPFLKSKEVKVTVRSEESNGLWPIIISWAPMLLFVGVWIFFMRRVQGGAIGGALSVTKSRAKLATAEEKKTFNDVAGCDEAKQELAEIVEFLREPAKFQRLGGKIPKGTLLVGPPGCGKTLLARAVAGEAGVPFFHISGSDFVELFVGVGAGRVRDTFEQAKTKAPCIIFFDEIDAVGRHRGSGLGGGHDEREQTLNQLLVELDGFSASTGVIVMAATNRPDVLDPALLRPGRFDRQVVVDSPDVRGAGRNS